MLPLLTLFTLHGKLPLQKQAVASVIKIPLFVYPGSCKLEGIICSAMSSLEGNVG